MSKGNIALKACIASNYSWLTSVSLMFLYGLEKLLWLSIFLALFGDLDFLKLVVHV